jgi:membrane associated rhomboid family serine protease
MFVRVETRRRPAVAWTTAILLLAMVVAFVAMATLGPVDRLRFLGDWGTVPAVVAQALPTSLAALAALRLQTLFTAIFIHADWLHLVGNLAFLLIFGVAAERVLGSLRFGVLFVVCGLLGNLAGALWLGDSRAPIVGASGAVSGIVGAYLALFPGARLGIVLPLGLFVEFVRMPAYVLIGFWALMQVLFSIVGPEFGAIAWAVHSAGFACGAAFAWLSRPSIARRQRNH